MSTAAQDDDDDDAGLGDGRRNGTWQEYIQLTDSPTHSIHHSLVSTNFGRDHLHLAAVQDLVNHRSVR